MGPGDASIKAHFGAECSSFGERMVGNNPAIGIDLPGYCVPSRTQFLSSWSPFSIGERAKDVEGLGSKMRRQIEMVWLVCAKDAIALALEGGAAA